MKLKINYRKKTEKKNQNTNNSRLKTYYQKNHCVNKERIRKVKIYVETNENENTTFQNLWDTVLSGKFTVT